MLLPRSALRTLGVAQYRAGNWNAAVEALAKTANLPSGKRGLKRRVPLIRCGQGRLPGRIAATDHNGHGPQRPLRVDMEIATNLGISYWTVREHVKAIYRAHGVRSQLMSMAKFKE
jgi:hypothetical protein